MSSVKISRNKRGDLAVKSHNGESQTVIAVGAYPGKGEIIYNAQELIRAVKAMAESKT